ncbi:MAG: DUF1488 family protein [Rickettsiales bacterium]|nr:DUF1488 family protein [Rickettsiales bacterium]
MERQFFINWQLLVEQAKQRRKSQKLTQKDLALLANVSAPTISNFENGDEDILVSSALNIMAVLGMVDKKNIYFYESKEAEYLPGRLIVRFWGYEGDKEIRCEISAEALWDNFKSDSEHPLKIFKDNRKFIENKIKQKYIKNEIESDGSILIRTGDL